MKNLTEEQRIREIDEIAHLFDPETVKAAKYGPTACTAQEMTYRAAVEAVQKGISPNNDGGQGRCQSPAARAGLGRG